MNSKSLRVRRFSLDVKLAALKARHLELKKKIGDELKRPAPCMESLQRLKRRRLRIKDEMARYEGLLRTLTALSPGQRRDRVGGVSA
ncbi:DUF465 domain-containing protein [Lutimaribacter marinistellae]|uniref:DUF465 domain-containing protein n=1 Tax=Lutimaribacter marinistellae TaxID=1820329 RepID=A0ABV7TI08_9RHOB